MPVRACADSFVQMDLVHFIAFLHYNSRVCCSVLQCVAVCCSMLQCAAVCCNERTFVRTDLVRSTAIITLLNYNALTRE